ncbi:subunit PAN2 of PAB-dependent poly(A)-specific ribonuclease [Chloropicon primus]|uniref:Subunit PAN2 of PAB-dependent poly(A)-specific ribonuclease n=3 Tax=Chloropicon primus TaxID=1764295 RepID=A0A5B8MKX4_9CHLO|nr:subunit PAN2 of PAB-dependent poly(A)-specific ribonuclease [Chloropicon primus]UPR00331.1 subunit PAN2 of PAB-dependent poly(A)-specific ribonuclease [Chloropicon primus]|eukprot:QDZ21117.1 subunit PAN2 of PAB-dependent poly(A)-specific ribonuclease [Chloropicon primus]
MAEGDELGGLGLEGGEEREAGVPLCLGMTQIYGGINVVRADPRREVVWLGGSTGDVCALDGSTLEQYACWNPGRANASDKVQNLPPHLQMTPAVLDLTPVGTEALVGSCTKELLTLSDVGGFTRFSRKIEALKWNKHQALQGKSKPATAACIEATYPGSSTISVGHSEGAVSLVDFSREGEMVACCWPDKTFAPLVNSPLSGVTCVAPYRRGVICALNSPKGGNMVVTDFRERRLCAIQPSLSCFSGAIGCIKTQSLNSDLVVCCGYSKSRYGTDGGFVRDPYIKVFDVRYAVRAVTQVLCGFAPVSITCHPKFSDCFMSFSEAGIVSLTDVSGGHGQVVQQFQLQSSNPYAQEGVQFSAGDISYSGDVFLFGDNIGNLQLWGNDVESTLNIMSMPLPAASDSSFESCSTFQMDESGPLACVPQYGHDPSEPLLSDFGQQDMAVGFPPRDLYPQVAREMTMVDSKLSVVRISNKNEEILKNLNYRISNPISRQHRRRDRKAKDVFVPGKYLYKQIQGGGPQEKFVEFDFKFYNTTKFAGLENNLPNCYCNPLLQVLYFTYPFCNELLRSTPDPNVEFCIRDELSFLVYMLRQAQGDLPCQAQNLMRALMQSQDALNVGVLSSTMDAQICRSTREIEADVNKEQSLFRRIQTLFRFLCEHLHKEELELKKLKSSSDCKTLAKSVYGFTNSVINKCTKGHVTKKDSLYFQTSVQLPKDTNVEKKFVELLQESLMSESSIRAWCNSCNAYVPMTQKRIVSSLPNVLAINCNVKNLQQLKFFSSTQNGTPWFKTKFYLKTDKAKGHILAMSGDDGQVDDDQWTEYDLISMISMLIDERGKNDYIDPDTNVDSITDTDAHFVAHVKVHPVYNTADAARKEGKWMLFNDFCVTPTDMKDVMQMYGHKKVPCMLFFAKTGSQDVAKKGLKSTPDLTKDGFHSLCGEKPLTYGRQLKNTFTSLNPKTESPGVTGMKIVGIDCEFVALSKTDKQLHPDGSETILKNARLVLARVSVVRGQGPLKNVCFIDDYVRAVEPVYDYLTRYSGLLEGDLDVGRSKHHLTTLKKTYMKLRYLVDQGCHFVGHGLKNDFKMINITVPPDQIIDTVELFRLAHQRYFSLRFLAAYLLKKDIQGVTHDSIEDANIALELYDVYCELKESGTLKAKLQEMYKWGRENKWDLEKLSTEG